MWIWPMHVVLGGKNKLRRFQSFEIASCPLLDLRILKFTLPSKSNKYEPCFLCSGYCGWPHNGFFQLDGVNLPFGTSFIFWYCISLHLNVNLTYSCNTRGDKNKFLGLFGMASCLWQELRIVKCILSRKSKNKWGPVLFGIWIWCVCACWIILTFWFKKTWSQLEPRIIAHSAYSKSVAWPKQSMCVCVRERHVEGEELTFITNWKKDCVLDLWSMS